MAKKLKVDLIHCPAMFGPINTQIPVVITIHDLSYFTHPQLMKTKIFTSVVKIMEKFAAANATRIIAISKSTFNDILNYLVVPESNIDLVLSAGRTVGLNRGVQQRKSNLFLAMGQRSPYKSLETAVLAWSHIPSSRRPKLVITGSHGRDPLIKLVSSLSLENSVELLHWVSDEQLDELMNSCTAIIETTQAAGFGMPALEAMSLSTPVIISDIPVFREIAGAAAEYFEVGNPSDLANKVLNLQADAERQRFLQEQGPLHSKMYTWQSTAAGTLSSFEKAISKN